MHRQFRYWYPKSAIRAFVLWLILVAGFYLWSMSPLGLDKSMVEYGKGGHPDETWGCRGKSAVWPCTPLEAIKQYIIQIPLIIGFAMIAPLIPIFFGGDFEYWSKLWFSPGALIVNPYLAVPLMYIVLAGFESWYERKAH